MMDVHIVHWCLMLKTHSLLVLLLLSWSAVEPWTKVCLFLGVHFCLFPECDRVCVVPKLYIFKQLFELMR